MPHPFHIVDVFAERAYAGNPLAVVVDADNLSDEQMCRIAGETNYSDTSFVRSAPESNGGYRLRIFTPAREIPFAGHPILGTAWVVRRHIAPGRPDTVNLNLPIGQVPVSFERAANEQEIAWFVAPEIETGRTCQPERIAAALGLSADDIDATIPVRQFAAGISAVLVPVRSLDALRRSRLDLDAYAPLARDGFSHLVYLFCGETHHPDNDICARFFFVAGGVREDPATGNAAAFLGVHLLEHRYAAPRNLSLRIEQGYEIGRPSLVMLRARTFENYHEVKVGGVVIPAVRGELL